jgi:hypothetical protein
MKLSRFVAPIALTLICLSSNSRDAYAVPINVPNFSYESNFIFDNAQIPSGVSGWTLAGGATVFNPASSDFTGSNGSTTPSGANGTNIATASTGGSLQSSASLTTVQSSTKYSLTVAIGNNLQGPTGNARVGFLLDDAFVTGRDITFDASSYAPAGTFSDYTFSFDSAAADVGKSLKIYLGATSGTNYVAFDNLRLNAVATPEPSTYAMMALGLVALCVLGAKRKKDGQAI